jgi:hypothetical protein
LYVPGWSCAQRSTQEDHGVEDVPGCAGVGCDADDNYDKRRRRRRKEGRKSAITRRRRRRRRYQHASITI